MKLFFNWRSWTTSSKNKTKYTSNLLLISKRQIQWSSKFNLTLWSCLTTFKWKMSTKEIKEKPKSIFQNSQMKKIRTPKKNLLFNPRSYNPREKRDWNLQSALTNSTNNTPCTENKKENRKKNWSIATKIRTPADIRKKNKLKEMITKPSDKSLCVNSQLGLSCKTVIPWKRPFLGKWRWGKNRGLMKC